MSEQLSWMRDVRVRIRHNDLEAVFRHRNAESDVLDIHFNVPFSDEPKPPECTVDIYNLSPTSNRRIRRGARVTVEAGYKGDRGVIARGIITEVSPVKITGVDRATSFKFLEGASFEKKDVNLTFAAGTTGLTIINRVANNANITISQISLPNNKVFKSGYTADGDAMGIIEEIAKDCGASVFYRRGSLIIRSITEGNDERFDLRASTGLLYHPIRIETNDYKGWNITSLLQHRISTASIIRLRSQTIDGTFRVKSGSHSFNGSNFTTQCEVVG